MRLEISGKHISFPYFYWYTHLKNKSRLKVQCIQRKHFSKSLDNLPKSRKSLPSIVKGTNAQPSLTYVPKIVEGGWNDWWEEIGYYKPNTSRLSNNANSFNVLLPPPNVTGTLHLGHALTATIQDVLARWHRMRGQSVLWVPGMDHAGIATQVVVEKKLWNEKGMTRYDIGRNRFVEEVWHWKDEKGDAITKQLRKLGASLDWSREIFTMDSKQSLAVMEAFIRLFNSGLIYRSNSLVNWSCVLQSAISDIEVDFKEVNGATLLSIPNYDHPVEFGILTKFAYKLCDREGEIVVSTTRVETMLGDVAIAVHPGDERYNALHGSQVWHPFRCVKIPIICDTCVDPDFGTGAVKITPAHDYTDFEVAKRHKLDILSVITEEGKISQNCGMFSGLMRFEARERLTAELDAQGLLRGRSDHNMQLPMCSRSGDVIEFLLKPQWFLDCRDMAQQAVAAVRQGDLQMVPEVFEKTWFNWLENIRDWCISRQLWWGHRVPMYQCSLDNDSSSIWVAARSMEEARGIAVSQMGLSTADGSVGRLKIKQDEDVLDTWFSSALLPFSVFGWPAETEDYQKFYPLTMMETGNDILFFWVARMVMLGKQLTGQLPFKKILLHGIICDAHGRKMSKSLGNVIYPEDIISGISLEELQKQAQTSCDQGLMSKTELQKTIAGQKKLFPAGIPECGTDALRFTLCSHNVKNHFINFDVNECHTNRLFCNKMWQASNYVRNALQSVDKSSLNVGLEFHDSNLGRIDRWILSRLSRMVIEVNGGLESHDLHIATDALKTFIYYDFCDVYLESTKCILRSTDHESIKSTCQTLSTCINTSFRALAPFMPFITETLYQSLPQRTYYESMMVAPYPLPDEWMILRDNVVEEEVETIKNVVTTVRRLKTTYNISKPKPTIHIVTPHIDLYQQYAGVLKSLADCEEVVITQETSDLLKSNPLVDTVGENCSVYLLVNEFNFKADSTKFLKKQEKLSKELAKLLKVTSSEVYKVKALPAVQKAHFDKIQSLQCEIKKLQELQESLNSIS